MFFLFEFLFYFLHFVCLLVPIIILIAFITLLERKEIASMQKRKGPNILGFFGLLQPFSDGLKLLLKEPTLPYNSDKIIFILSPVLTFTLSICSYCILPLGGDFSALNIDFGILYLLGLSSLSVYGIILSGWSSNSKYAFFGALRSSAQMLSYEVFFSLAILPTVIISHSLNLVCIVSCQHLIWFIFPLIVSGSCIFIAILAETNRSPFDLPEAEAELVAGYNVEYSSIFFAMFYLAEYLSIILMSNLFVLTFLGGWFLLNSVSLYFYSLKVIFVVYLVIWVRATFPRYRFDQLIQIAWKVLLPIILGFFIYCGGITFVSVYLIIFLL